MIAFAVLVALQTAAVPAAAVPATEVPPGATATAVPKAAADDKMICQQEDTVGTRLGAHKRCMTRSQWREAYQQERDAVRHAQDSKGYVHY